ncbi:MAG: hypothetical protein GTO41_08410 [Burkholderiales bacterium]|nr:hypothetical protein [Burkholderiales bacterium]
MQKWMLALLLGLLAVPALAAGRLAQVDVVDAHAGRTLPVYYDHGRYYVTGVPGREYTIRIRNRTHADLLAVVSVDGVNVVTGETAAVDQGGYILNRRQRFDIKGWRKSLEEVASFYFSNLDDSYAARTGRPDNVGVIGVALFKRKVVVPFADGFSAPGEPAAPRARKSEEHSEDAQRLGTGHGRRQGSVVRYGHFERESESPNEIVTIHYDSRANLIARGIIPGVQTVPDPFPSGFVADPPNG